MSQRRRSITTVSYGVVSASYMASTATWMSTSTFGMSTSTFGLSGHHQAPREGDELRAAVALARDVALCTPVPSNYTSPFRALGILPHGQPLFMDGSTCCKTCHRVIRRYSDLVDGTCAICDEAFREKLEAEKKRQRNASVRARMRNTSARITKVATR